MKINVFIDEIEFEEGIEFTFHDQIRIKKTFERELRRLFLATKNDNNDSDFSILRTLNNNKIYSRNVNFIKEIDGGEITLFVGDKNPHEVSKRLAKSIFSSLTLMDAGKVRSSNTTSIETSIK